MLRTWARRAFVVLLWVNLLDLTTSLVPSPADHVLGIPERSTAAWIVQGLLVLPLLAHAWTLLPAARRFLASLPVPRTAAIVLGLFVAVQLVHVSLRLEQYPFSPVAMFGSAMPEPPDEEMVITTYVVHHPDGLEAMSFLREGNPWFARHGFGWDYKAGWAMHMYGPTHSTAREVIRRGIAAEALPPPVRARVGYRRSTGRLVWWRPLDR